MAIKIKILDSPPEETEEPSMIIKVKIKDKETKKIFLKAKKTIDGNIIVYGHPDINIFIMTKTSKVVSIPKEELDDEVHDTQDRLFSFLINDGVIDPDSEGDKVEYVLYSISKFVNKELPLYKDQEEFEKEENKRLLEPEPDEFTEFDPRRHKDNKGSLAPNMISYGINTIYRL
jgi:hypothetical protein